MLKQPALASQVCDQCGVSFVRLGQPVQLSTESGLCKTFCSIDCKEQFKVSNSPFCFGCGIPLQSGQLAYKYVVSNKECKLFCSSKCLTKSVGCIYASDDNNQSSTKLKAQEKLNVFNQHSNASECSDFQSNAVKQETQNCYQCFNVLSNFNPAEPVTTLQYFGKTLQFCDNHCLNEFKTKNEKLGRCVYCEVEKNIFAMVESQFSGGKVLHFCSLNCFFSHIGKNNSIPNFALRECTVCNKRGIVKFLVKRDGTTSGFCSNACADNFINDTEVQPSSHTGTLCNVKKEIKDDLVVSNFRTVTEAQNGLHINDEIAEMNDECNVELTQSCIASDSLNVPEIKIQDIFSTRKDIDHPEVVSKKATKNVSCSSSGTQTNDSGPTKIKILPVPVPIYVPCPAKMFCDYAPFPIAVPIPVPIPVFLPTTLTNVSDIVNTIEELKDEIPSNPIEADLLAIAEAVANVKTEKFSAKFEISPTEGVEVEICYEEEANMDDNCDGIEQNSFNFYEITAADRLYLLSDKEDEEIFVPPLKRTRKLCKKITEINKPDKEKVHSEVGTKLWEIWACDNIRNKSSLSTFNISDVIPVSRYELDSFLSKFCHDLKHPSGSFFRSDSMYYIFLGIQKHLKDVKCVNNIFADSIFQSFQKAFYNSLDDRLPTLKSWGQTSRITEDHLWECNQLGAHSPQTLLFTLVYFITKCFLKKTADEHASLTLLKILQLNSNFLKRCKNAELTFRIRKETKPNVTEKINDNPPHPQEFLYEEKGNPLRCPTRLFEFYLSKCPSVIRTKFSYFYLSPEKHCIPESPVWFSNVSLTSAEINAMLVRVLLVKDVYDFWKKLEDSS